MVQGELSEQDIIEAQKDNIKSYFSWTYDEENATVTIKAKSYINNYNGHYLNLNEFMRFRIYVVC